jgi:hypothetical protein
MFSTILGGHLQFPGMRSWGRLSGNSTVRYRKALCLGLFTSIILNHVKSSKSKSKWAKLSPFVDFRLSQFPSPRHPKALPKALLWRPRVVVNRFPQAFIPWSGRTPRKAPVFMIWKIPIDSIVFQTPSEKSICVYIIIYICIFLNSFKAKSLSEDVWKSRKYLSHTYVGLDMSHEKYSYPISWNSSWLIGFPPMGPWAITFIISPITQVV